MGGGEGGRGGLVGRGGVGVGRGVLDTVFPLTETTGAMRKDCLSIWKKGTRRREGGGSGRGRGVGEGS